MLSAIAAVVLSTGGVESAMPLARYPAKSDMPDTVSAGGWGTSTNGSWSLAEVNVKADRLSLVVQKNACCGPGEGNCPMIVVLANGSASPVWLRAEDSWVGLIREAKDAKGVWRPVEYRPTPDCGNSRHRVALNAGRCFSWDVPETKGGFATKSRYVLVGQDDTLWSNEFDAKIDPASFVPPADFPRLHQVPAKRL
ncbi:MAG: hypothetical protein JST30_13950 [Armatimonadetes bacterium]|nr:hypothetical protein [Armatimonadota bacterium]